MSNSSPNFEQAAMQSNSLTNMLGNQLASTSSINSLAQYQQMNLRHGLALQNDVARACTKAVLRKTERETKAARDTAVERALDAGGKIIDRITFWREIPLIGPVIADPLADKLNEISEQIERAFEWRVGDVAECIRRDPWKPIAGTLPERMPAYGETCRVIEVLDDPDVGTVLGLAGYQPEDYPTSKGLIAAANFRQP